MLDNPDWTIMEPGDERWPEAEQLWTQLAANVKAAVHDYCRKLNEAFPGGHFGVRINAPSVTVAFFPPRDHPAYNPDNPTACLVVTIGP